MNLNWLANLVCRARQYFMISTLLISSLVRKHSIAAEIMPPPLMMPNLTWQFSRNVCTTVVHSYLVTSHCCKHSSNSASCCTWILSRVVIYCFKSYQVFHHIEGGIVPQLAREPSQTATHANHPTITPTTMWLPRALCHATGRLVARSGIPPKF
jgi:hypothetical protein